MASAARKLSQKLHTAHLNPLALLRLAPKNEFESLIEGGYSTDLFGWFGEAWFVFKAKAKEIALASIPAILVAFISFYFYYRDVGRAAQSAGALFGSYIRTGLIMWLSLIPSSIALGLISYSKKPWKDFQAALRKLPQLLVIAVAVWAPLIFSGLMQELGGRVYWWAIPVALYLAISFSFAPFLLIDGRLSLCSSLETSRRAVSRNWFGIATLYAIYYPAAWVFSAALSMIPGIFSTMIVVDDMAKKTANDPINIMLGFSNIFMAGLFYILLIFFQIVLATAYIRIFRPVGYRSERAGS